ncbi:O-antigen ligase family protein [Stappia sp. F7233]|uniref:O-antigen ligase family protein n=1 Tax=Stappia albiluteola TaxID=2758565 RepID=A0A839ACD1_9HYPH|nr:O-antigen ligase family protein [Stappia albiluteola]MBA5777131.1 O-antigen ligase family protein [Stappia albiluteola]
MADAQTMDTGREQAGQAARAGWRPGPASRWLAVLFILLLPFSAVDIGLPLGDFAHNAALPFFLALALACLSVLRSGDLRCLAGRDEAYFFALVFLAYFGWCAVTTLITGVIFEYQALDAFGFSPFTHSVARFPIPVFLGFVILVSFLVARFVLSARALDRVLFVAAGIVTVYGWMQFYALEFHPGWYTRLALMLEGARTGQDFLNIDYVALKGRINLTTYEAAEGARLVLILFLPALFTMPLTGRLARLCRALAVGSMFLFILAAETLVGLAGLGALMAMLLLMAPRRLQMLLALLILITGVAGYLLLPPEFADRLHLILTNPGLAQADESAITRAAFAYASLKIVLVHPLFGIGWSKDIFFMSEAIPEWGNTWEVMRSVTTGEAVAAKSLAVRILLYGGVPAFLLLAWFYLRLTVIGVTRFARTADQRWKRLVLVLVTFGVCGIIDGGILSTLYPWAALGLALGGAAGGKRAAGARS